MTYNKIILDESVLNLDTWLPQDAIDALTELVYDVKLDNKEAYFKIFKLSKTSFKTSKPLEVEGNSFFKVEKLQYSEIIKKNDCEYDMMTQEAA
ncbi:hypothetical protein [Enterococcus faecalis]|uniref:hypothetical protein n=1 Tax=Enterococcus faecalis TaxID=1351 RepID=UPI0030C7ED43